MTPEDVRKLSTTELEDLFDSLRAGPKPEGIYDGKAWSHHHWFKPAIYGFGWRGKTFTGARVVNRIFGVSLFPGILTGNAVLWTIFYPNLGLIDEMKWTGDFYLGRMRLSNGNIWFTLL